MSTYAKYADMYRQRLARSQDTRLDLTNNISPVRSHSASKVNKHLDGASIQASGPQQNQTIGAMSPQSMRLQQQQVQSRGGAQSFSAAELVPSHIKLGQDRSAYMTFLEVQLERVTAACTSALTFQQKVETLGSQVASSDEKVSNIGRLVKLLQSFSEAQEEDVQLLKSNMASLSHRLEEVALQQHRMSVQNLQTNSVGETYEPAFAGGPPSTSKHMRSVSPTRSRRSNSKSRSPSRGGLASEAKASGPMGERVTRLEAQLRTLTRGKRNTDGHHMQSDSFGTLEQAPQLKSLASLKDDLNNFAQEVDRQMRDTEARIVTNLSQHIEDNNGHTNAKIDEALILLDQKVQRLELAQSAAAQRPAVIESTQIIEDGRINPAKMEAALNDWLGKVEEQVNQIEDKVNTRADKVDLKVLERRLADDCEDREGRLAQLEQYCQRVGEQAQAMAQEQSLDWEDRFLHIQRQIETALMANANGGGNPSGTFEQNSGLTSQFDNVIGDGSPMRAGLDPNKLRTLEKKLAKRLGEGVDRLGQIIKDLAKAQRQLETRTASLEIKVHGGVKGDAKKTAKQVVKKPSDAQVAVSSRTKNSAKALKQSTGGPLRNSNSVKSPQFQAGSGARGRRSQRSLSPPVKDAFQGRPISKQRASSRRARSKSSLAARSRSAHVDLSADRPRTPQAEATEVLTGRYYPHQMDQNFKRGSLNNFKTSFERRLLQEGGVSAGGSVSDQGLSPREILRRARDRSVRELSQSFTKSRHEGDQSRSPHSHRLQSLVELEQASPHQHRISTSFNQMSLSQGVNGGVNDNQLQQNVSILNGPVSGQKNIVAGQDGTHHEDNGAYQQDGLRHFEMDQFRQRQGSASGGRGTPNQQTTYMTQPVGFAPNAQNELMTQDSYNTRAPGSIKKRKVSSSAQRSAIKAANQVAPNIRVQSRDQVRSQRSQRSVSRSRERSQGGSAAGFTLKELEKREKSLKRRLAKRQSDKESTLIMSDPRSKVTATKAVRVVTVRDKRNAGIEGRSKERSLSQRTFQKMSAAGHTSVLSGPRFSANTTTAVHINSSFQNQSAMHNPDTSFRSAATRPQQARKKTPTSSKPSKSRQQHQQLGATLSPNKTTGQLKTTKSVVNPTATQVGGYKNGGTSLRHKDVGSGRAVGAGNLLQQRQRSRSAQAIARDEDRTSKKQSSKANTTVVSAEQRRNPSVAKKTNAFANATAAQEIFNQPFDSHQASLSLQSQRQHQHQQNVASLGTNEGYQPVNGYGGPSNTANTWQPAISKKQSSARQRSGSADRSRDERKARLKGTGPASAKKQQTGAAAAKQKLKNLQNKKSNVRLAKLEKMYQELTEIEAKTAAQI